MKKLSLRSCLPYALVLILGAALTGCNQNTAVNEVSPSSQVHIAEKSTQTATAGGVIYLKVNPEIAVSYDEAGMVTQVAARNDDALKILANYSGFIGKECKVVIPELVKVIGEAGYNIDEVDGSSHQIIIEIEAGSQLPNATFLDDVVTEVRNTVEVNTWQNPVNVQGAEAYGLSNYSDTDYGSNNDGVTDYNDTDYGPNNDGVMDYNDTDYGPNNDGVTDYNDTDYGPNNDGVTDYNDTDYGPNNDGVTDYNDTDYGPNNDGVTDYNDTDYGPNSDGVTDYNNTDYGPNSDGVTDYNSGNSNYDSGNSNYNDGGSNYDD